MCPKRPCYTCKEKRCLLFDHPELEPENKSVNNFASVRGMTGESIQGTYKSYEKCQK